MDVMLNTLDTLWDVLVAAFGPLGPLYALGAAGLFLVALSAPFALKKPVNPLDRLTETAPAPKGIRPQINENRGEALKLRAEPTGLGLDAFANYLEPQDQKEFGAVRLKLIQAGYRSRSAVSTYHFLRVALGLGMLGIGLLGVFIFDTQEDVMKTIMTVLIPGLIGYFGPDYWVTRRVESRKDEIATAFPDALDLMLVCVEAGQSLDQGIMRVAREIKTGYPVLAEEFEIVANEVRAGKERVTVLRDMAERCGVPDVSSFVTVLIQSASFGTSIASALRVYSAEMRDKRVMRAEEKANVLPTKLTLGTMMFTVPPLLLLLVGPSVYGVMQTLTGG